MKIVRSDALNPDFIKLVKYLDEELTIRDGDNHVFYAQFDKIDNIRYTVIMYENDTPIGCGAIKKYGAGTMEVKRIYIKRENRGNGAAAIILKELESWANELGYKKCILETGTNNPEAIGLYKKNGYRVIVNYSQYAGIETSVCFEKDL
ncbi:MAG TPA: GNAT family N-acetyltransferase [Hanamia sp.]|nr:GNAT family N-acetyltransferase [Hanamia sp.]